MVAGEVVEVGARPEAVVRVVGADLLVAGRDDQHLARKLLRERAPARREALATGQRRHGPVGVGPRLRHEREQIGRRAAVVRRRLRRFVHLHALNLLREKSEGPARAAYVYRRGVRGTATRASAENRAARAAR